MSNKRRGCNYERQLVDLLHGRGFAAVRVAGSGAKSLPSPDIVAIRKGGILAIECKTTKKNQVYVSDDQISNLYKYSETAGAKPLIAVKFTQREWYFLPPSKVPRTNGSAIVVSRELAGREGLKLPDLESLLGKKG